MNDSSVIFVLNNDSRICVKKVYKDAKFQKLDSLEKNGEEIFNILNEKKFIGIYVGEEHSLEDYRYTFLSVSSIKEVIINE